MRFVYVKLGKVKNVSLEEAKKTSEETLLELEQFFLSESRYLAFGDSPSIADLALLWHLAELIDFGIKPSDTIKTYLNDLYAASPSLKEDVALFLDHTKKTITSAKQQQTNNSETEVSQKVK